MLRNPENDTSPGGGGGYTSSYLDHRPSIVLGENPPQNNEPVKAAPEEKSTEVETKNTEQKSDESKTDEPKTDEKKDEASGWTLEKFLESIGEKDLKPDDPRLKQWKDVRTLNEKAIKANAELSARVTSFEQREQQLVKELEEARKGVKTGESTPSDVTAAKAELEQLRSKHEKDLEELAQYRAKEKISENPAFKEKYEGGRANILKSAKDVAARVKISDEDLDKVFSAGSEYDIHKTINELGVEDSVAVKLLTEKALAFHQLTSERDAVLSGKSGEKPADVLARWEAYHAQLGGVMTQRFTETLQGQLLGALDVVKSKLAETSPTFKTPAGDTVMEEIRSRFQEGLDLHPEEVVSALAWNRLGPIYEQTCTEQVDKIRQLEAQVAKLTNQLPSNVSKTAAPDVASKSSAKSNTDYVPFGPRQPFIELGK